MKFLKRLAERATDRITANRPAPPRRQTPDERREAAEPLANGTVYSSNLPSKAFGGGDLFDEG